MPVECETCGGSGGAPGTHPTACDHLRRRRRGSPDPAFVARPDRDRGSVPDVLGPRARSSSTRARRAAARGASRACARSTSTFRPVSTTVSACGSPAADRPRRAAASPATCSSRCTSRRTRRSSVGATSSGTGCRCRSCRRRSARTLELDTLDGPREIEVQSGTQPGARIRFHGLGVPSLRTRPPRRPRRRGRRAGADEPHARTGRSARATRAAPRRTGDPAARGPVLAHPVGLPSVTPPRASAWAAGARRGRAHVRRRARRLVDDRRRRRPSPPTRAPPAGRRARHRGRRRRDAGAATRSTRSSRVGCNSRRAASAGASPSSCPAVDARGRAHQGGRARHGRRAVHRARRARASRRCARAAASCNGTPTQADACGRAPAHVAAGGRRAVAGAPGCPRSTPCPDARRPRRPAPDVVVADRVGRPVERAAAAGGAMRGRWSSGPKAASSPASSTASETRPRLGLGPYVLRAETAPIAAVAVVARPGRVACVREWQV